MARALLLLALAFTVTAHEHQEAEREEKSHPARVGTTRWKLGTELCLPSNLRTTSKRHDIGWYCKIYLKIYKKYHDSCTSD